LCLAADVPEGHRYEATQALRQVQATAVEALDQLRPRPDSPLLFPNSRGVHLDFRNFNRRHWKPVQKALGIDPLSSGISASFMKLGVGSRKDLKQALPARVRAQGRDGDLTRADA
jgi:hypothetical protein